MTHRRHPRQQRSEAETVPAGTSDVVNGEHVNPSDAAARVPFSLFDGDPINRIFARLNLGSDRVRDLVGRSGCLVFLTWGMLVSIVLLSGSGRSGPPGKNFFLDFAAYLQFVLGLPLFVVAERIVAKRTEETAWLFVTTGVVSPADAPRLDAVHQRLARMRQSVVPDLACLAVGVALSVVTIAPELHAAIPTWHTARLATGATVFSAPGRWEMWVALPVLNYWWLRWVWKIILWCLYLFYVSRFRLTIAASHPDSTGGLGFLSEAQTNFGLVILAYGISNISSTIGYKVIMEHASPGQITVWGPFVTFVIAAPLLFTLPLLLFTTQLLQAKRRLLEAYRVRTTAEAVEFENQWGASASPSTEVPTPPNLAAYSQWRALYQHVQGMRVVPFDLRSFSELVGYATGPFLPLLTLTEKLDSPPVKWLLNHMPGR